ncbi:DUF2778 domain-containing protein [Saccharibacter floricola]|uniref:Tlde1 domain-containing protein n=1 Tax=Saccharibacter floricola DSM 15669 TaxID=1123227 RepID=A0ABQ0P1M6_9PROT|nr:DUF2778 domain-containing protein [Saccharibacter floricola]GBQ08829.1 hypothetical protein AA15669_1925 [Saccharibacter floricola DSM 15669]
MPPYNKIPEGSFILNNNPMSELDMTGIGKFKAFSGAHNALNDPSKTDQEKIGPLPKGTYYIVDRPHGGFRQALHDLLDKYLMGSDPNMWFALYRKDDKIDDQTIINGQKRSSFRLHPQGHGILVTIDKLIHGFHDSSIGCLTLPNADDAYFLQKELLRHRDNRQIIPGTNIRYYGIIYVK